MRACGLDNDSIFRRGDGTCFHRNLRPGGRSVCVSRFRLVGTHSLLLQRHLGRNLITLFSTVNTWREKKSRDAPQSTRARAANRAASAAATCSGDCRPHPPFRNETSFLQQFYSRTCARAAAVNDHERHFARRDGGNRESVNGSFPGFFQVGIFSRRTSPIARICANSKGRFASSAMRQTRIATAASTSLRVHPAASEDDFDQRASRSITRAEAPIWNACTRRSRSARAKKKPPALRRAASVVVASPSDGRNRKRRWTQWPSSSNSSA